MAKPSISEILSSGPSLKEEEPMEESDVDAETEAMRMFKAARTPEQMAEALKSFLQACGVY